MSHKHFNLMLGTLLMTPLWASNALADVAIPGPMASWQIKVESIGEMRFRQVVRQRYDFSCGSAALATLLSFSYQRPVTEAETFDGMYRAGDQATIREQGFSLLDMKLYLEREKALQSDGFRLDLDQLAALGIPAIAMIETEGYRHFVVITGIRDGQVLVADPAFGVTSYSTQRFSELWVNGIAFMIRDDVSHAQASFNRDSAWAALTTAPLDAISEPTSLSAFTLNQLGIGPW